MKYNMRISPTDDCVWFNEEATLMIDGDTPEEAMVAAMILDSHNQFTEENAKLREVLESLIYESEHGFGYVDINDAKQLLNQLEEQQNEKQAR